MEIVFSNSDKGVINRAKSEGVLGSVGHLKDLFDQTILFGGAFDMGPINCSPISDQRKQLVRSTFYSEYWASDENIQTEKRFNAYWEEYGDCYNRIIQLGKEGGAVRIWYSCSPSAQCGFFQTVYLLKDFNCKISFVKLPAYRTTEHLEPLTSWGEVRPEEISRYFVEEQLSFERKSSMIKYWEQLMKENTPLRVVVNGHLISAQEDFYDSLINKMIGRTPFQVSHLIVDMMRAYSLGIGDFILSERLKALTRCNVLEVVKRNAGFYDSVLKKSE